MKVRADEVLIGDQIEWLGTVTDAYASMDGLWVILASTGQRVYLSPGSFVKVTRTLQTAITLAIFKAGNIDMETSRRLAKAAMEAIQDHDEEYHDDDGAGLIAAERARQVNELGFTAEHDGQHTEDQLIRAAAYYMRAGQAAWPWRGAWPPLGDRRGDLIKAGALIAAEIDRQSPPTPTVESPATQGMRRR